MWYDKDYTAAALGGFTYGVTTEEMAGGYAQLQMMAYTGKQHVYKEL